MKPVLAPQLLGHLTLGLMLGRQAGYGVTDIDPFWHPKGRTMFDVGRVAQRDGEAIERRIAPVLANLLLASAGGCTDLCRARTLAHAPKMRQKRASSVQCELVGCLCCRAARAGQPAPDQRGALHLLVPARTMAQVVRRNAAFLHRGCVLVFKACQCWLRLH